MSGLLERMAMESRARVAAAEAREPLAALRRRAIATPVAPPLRHARRFELIAEFKRRSPSSGDLRGGDDDLADRVTRYANAGAVAVSVLTEPLSFGGQLEDLAAAAAVLSPLGVPVMRKDFLVAPYQLHEARAAGAGGVLLIVRMLSSGDLAAMLDCARDLDLFVLLETFDEADVAIALSLHARQQLLIGVNCRDLQTLEVIPGRHATLAALLPGGSTTVAESGIATPGDCAEAVRAGYDMALIGGALMQAPDPGGLIRAMLAAGRAVA